MQFTGHLIAPNSKNYHDMSDAQKAVMQYSSLVAQMNAERIALENHDSFISERSLLDFLPYMQEFLEGSTLSKTSWLYDYAFYERMVKEHLRTVPYDLLVYLPVEFTPTAKDLEQNKWKERDAERRKHTDKRIFELTVWVLKNVPDTMVMRISGSLEKRTDDIVEKIKEILQ